MYQKIKFSEKNIFSFEMGETILSKNLTGTGISVYSSDFNNFAWGITDNNKKKFKKGDIVIGARGTIGSIKLPKEDFFTATQTTMICKILDTNIISTNFLYYYLTSLKWDKIKSGTTIPMLTIANIKTLEIPLPPLPTQHLIVSEIEKQFFRLDEGLLSIRRVKENLKKYKASVLKSAVEGKLTEDFRNNPPTPLYQGGIEKKSLSQGGTQKHPPCERGAWGDLNNSTEIFIPYNIKLKDRARELRKNMTEPEKNIWYFLKQFNERNNNYGLTILRQKPLDNFIVDFYISKLGLVIEIDGDSHFDEQGIAYDIERTQILEGYGLKVIRFTNKEVMNNFDGVCEKLENVLISQIIPLTPFHKGELKEELDNSSFITPPGQRGQGGLLTQILEERKKKFLTENPGKKYKEPEAIKQDDLPNIELPKGWEWCNLEQITNKITDGTHLTPKYIKEDEINGRDVIKFLSAKNIKDFKLTIEDFKYILKTEHEELNKKIQLEKGDVFIAKSGSIGQSTVFNLDDEFSIFESLAILKVINKKMSDYICLFVNSDVGQKQIKSKSKGVAVQHLHLEDIRKLFFPLPPLSEQNEIVKIVESKLSVVEKLEKIVNENIKKAENLKQSILKKAFEGELVREE